MVPQREPVKALVVPREVQDLLVVRVLPVEELGLRLPREGVGAGDARALHRVHQDLHVVREEKIVVVEEVQPFALRLREGEVAGARAPDALARGAIADAGGRGIRRRWRDFSGIIRSPHLERLVGLVRAARERLAKPRRAITVRMRIDTGAARADSPRGDSTRRRHGAARSSSRGSAA